jgi:hypothetical protein
MLKQSFSCFYTDNEAKCNVYGGSGENYVMRSLMILYITKYCAGDKLEKKEMGGACSAYGGEERRTQDFGGET